VDSRGETSGVLRVVEKVVGFTRRGVLTPREAVNKITDELAHYRRGDLAEAVLPLLSPELSSELRTWVEEVLQPGYRYRWFGLGEAPPEDERLRMQAELVSLASRLQHWGIASAADGHRNDAATV
jgi:hypothetical protein